MEKILFNLSVDKLEIYKNNYLYLLEKTNLERDFPSFLKKILSKDYNFKIYIINGPGSFTTLRIGTLSLNILNFVNNYSIKIFNIGKLEFFRYFVNLGILPKKGIIYIGQRKKARLYDFIKNNYEYIFYNDINKLKDNYFIDKIHYLNNNNKIEFKLSENNLIFKFENKEIATELNSLPFKQVKILKPEYMLQPNICQKTN